MTERYIRSFSLPDEVIEVANVRSELISKGGMTVSHDIQQPGWRWSVDIKPLVGTEWCQVRHIGVVLSGRIGYLLEDGTQFEAGPLDLMDVPAGHDAWVIGDEPLETIAWAGARGWLEPLESMSDRILATLLFTDVVGSTATAQRLGHVAWADLLSALETRTRDLLSQFRGREVKMTGDGVLAMFDGPGRAVRCAKALRAGAADLGLQLRIGVHAGEIDLAGEDIRGLAIHEASRIMGLADPGEILVSSFVATLAGDSGIRLVPRGEHELRGLPGRHVLFAVE